MRFVLCIICLFCFFSSGCRSKSYVAVYGFKHNTIRRSLGVPIIPSHWTIQDMGSYFDCFEPSPAINKPYRLRKRVTISGSGVVVEEEDTYFSGKTFRDPVEGGVVREEIILTYVYGAGGSTGSFRARAVFVPKGAPVPGDGVSRPVGIAEADKALLEWGLPRS